MPNKHFELYEGRDIFKLYHNEVVKEILVDRAQYHKYFTILEKYISDKNIVICGKSAYSITMVVDLPYTDYKYELICSDIFTHAKALATAFFEETRNNYIYVHTNILNREVTVIVNERELVRITFIDQYKGVNLINHINAREYPGIFASDVNVKIVGPEIQMIDILRNLYSPTMNKQWEEYKIQITNLMKILEKPDNKESPASINGKYEDANEAPLDYHEMILSNEPIHIEGSAELSEKLLERIRAKKLIHIEDNIYISHYKMDDVAEFLQLKNYNENSLKLPFDFRLRRTTFYSDENKPILYIYNCAQYDLINSSPYVKLRILFIEIWVLRLIRDMGELNANFANKKINHYYEKIIETFNSTINANYDTLFPIDYIGIYYEERIAKKQQMLSLRRAAIPNWYPAKNLSF